MTSESVAYNDMDLYVPEENLEAVSQVASELGTIGTTDHVIEELKNYYQENYPYTVRPGKTPKKKDFVNYFLLFLFCKCGGADLPIHGNSGTVCGRLCD